MSKASATAPETTEPIPRLLRPIECVRTHAIYASMHPIRPGELLSSLVAVRRRERTPWYLVRRSVFTGQFHRSMQTCFAFPAQVDAPDCHARKQGRRCEGNTSSTSSTHRRRRRPTIEPTSMKGNLTTVAVPVFVSAAFELDWTSSSVNAPTNDDERGTFYVQDKRMIYLLARRRRNY